MSAIRVKTVIDSDTLHLPQLRPLIGHSVEIIVVDQEPPQEDDAFWKGRSVDELAAMQGVTAPKSLEELYGDWTDEDFKGFEQAVRKWRESNGASGGLE